MYSIIQARQGEAARPCGVLAAMTIIGRRSQQPAKFDLVKGADVGIGPSRPHPKSLKDAGVAFAY